MTDFAKEARDRFVHSVCGENHTLPAGTVGCGGPIHICAEVYRCTDCGTPFHRDCARRHFAEEPSTERAAGIAEAAEIARERDEARAALLVAEGIIAVTAAPCQIDGCQYARAAAAERQLAEARAALAEITGFACHGPDCYGGHNDDCCSCGYFDADRKARALLSGETT